MDIRNGSSGVSDIKQGALQRNSENEAFISHVSSTAEAACSESAPIVKNPIVKKGAAADDQVMEDIVSEDPDTDDETSDGSDSESEFSKACNDVLKASTALPTNAADCHRRNWYD